MAEGGVETSTVAIASMMCEICLDEDSFRQGMWFCQQCRQRLCDKCRTYHIKVTTTKGHALIRTDEMPVTSSNLEQLEDASDEVRAPICQLHNLPFEFYCKDHNSSVCTTCKLMEHRNCPLQDLEHAAVGSSERSLGVLQSLREIESHMEKIRDAIVEEKAGLGPQEDSAIEMIQKKIKEFEILGQKTISEIKGLFQKERKSRDKDTDILTQSKVVVGKRIKELEKVTQTGSKEEIFVETKKAEEDVSKFQAILHDSGKVSHTKINFEPDRKLADIITSLDLGRARAETFTVDLAPKVTKVLYTGSHKNILLINVFPSGQMIVLSCHIDKSQMRLYNDNMRLLSTLDLPVYTVSADMLDDHRVIVGVPQLRELQIVNIDNAKLTMGSAIKTDMAPVELQKASDSTVLVYGYQLDWSCCFEILDLEGKIEKHSELSSDLPSPGCMALSHDKTAVFIVDTNKGCLGINLQGGVLFHYTHTNYAIYGGLAKDPRGDIYFSVSKKDQGFEYIIKLSSTGHMLGQIDTRATFTHSIPMQCFGNKLYAYGRKDKNKWAIFYIDV